MDVVNPLSIEVRARVVLGIDKIEVYERNGNLGRSCWVTINGNRYYFVYNYDTYQIDLKKHGKQGVTIHSFDNNTPHRTIKSVVGKM